MFDTIDGPTLTHHHVLIVNIQGHLGSSVGWAFDFSSWSHNSWVPAPCPALCWQFRAWSLFHTLCLPLSLPLIGRFVSLQTIHTPSFVRNKPRPYLAWIFPFCHSLPLHLSHVCPLSCIWMLRHKPPLQSSSDLIQVLGLKYKHMGVPRWLSQLSIRLQLRSWSPGLWVWVPCPALCWQFRAWSLLQILCLPLSLLLPCSLSQK